MVKLNFELILIGVIALLILGARFVWVYAHQVQIEAGDTVAFEHRFLSSPRTTEFSQYFFWNNALVTLPKYPTYHYGETVHFTGVAEKTSSGEDGMTERLIIRDPEAKKIEKRDILAVATFVRQHFLRLYNAVLPPKEAGLLAGIVLGAEEGIGEQFKDQLKLTGMLHVVVASGSNVALVAGAVFAIFLKLVGRKHATFVTIGVITFYALITGFDSPIVRASIMASFAFGAQLFGRQRVGLLSLMFAAWIMLIVDPLLISDIGFQLSFSATGGILVFQKSLSVFTRLLPEVLREDFVTSVSAQIGAFPFMMMAFGTYNLLSVLTNLLLLWTIPLVMVFGGVAGVVGLAMPVVAIPFLLLAYPLLWLFSTVVEYASLVNLPIQIDSVFLPVTILYYVVLVVWLYRKSRTHDEKIKK